MQSHAESKSAVHLYWFLIIIENNALVKLLL